MKDLAVIIPVYNEETVIAHVITDWQTCLDSLHVDYDIILYNDGSTDNTAAVCAKISENTHRVLLKNKKNSGHGPTILAGYREHCANYQWIFQVDSDNEMAACHFPNLWGREYDFIVGRRNLRVQPLSRRVVSFFSRAVAHALTGTPIWDVNSPYRLMRSESFAHLFKLVPANAFAPNVIISALAGLAKLRCLELPVPHEERKTGEVSIKQWKLAKAACIAFAQSVSTILFARVKIRNISERIK